MHLRACFAAVLLVASHASAAKEATGPLSPRERRVYDGAQCETFRNTLADATKGEQPEAVDHAITTIRRPDAESPSQWQTCIGLALRDRVAYKVRLVESEAVKQIETFAASMARVYESTGKLCGSTTAAPPSVTLMAKGPYGVKDGDWDATWDCVGSPMLNSQRFQYQITVDQKKRSFTITARGYPAADGKVRTLTRTGKVEGNAVKLGELQRK